MEQKETIRIRIVKKDEDKVKPVEGIEKFSGAIMAIALGQVVMDITQKALKETFKEKTKDENK